MSPAGLKTRCFIILVSRVHVHVDILIFPECTQFRKY